MLQFFLFLNSGTVNSIASDLAMTFSGLRQKKANELGSFLDMRLCD